MFEHGTTLETSELHLQEQDLCKCRQRSSPASQRQNAMQRGTHRAELKDGEALMQLMMLPVLESACGALSGMCGSAASAQCMDSLREFSPGVTKPGCACRV